VTYGTVPHAAHGQIAIISLSGGTKVVYRRCRHIGGPLVDTGGMCLEQTKMNAHFSKWGNSYAVRIPAALARELDVSEGKAADIAVKDGCLVVTPIPGPVYTLDQLLEGMTTENMYGEISTGEPVGNEVW
jgi:antitoxin MazE